MLLYEVDKYKPVEVTMPFLDFEEIKQNNPIETVIDKLGLTMKNRNNQFRGKCPRCEGSGERELCITPSKASYYCFADKKGGDVIQLVAHIKDIDVKEAAQWLSGSVPKEKKPRKSKPSEGDDFKPLDYLQHDHEAVEAVGFDPEDAKRIGVGYAPRGVMRGTVAIPVRDTTGRLLGYIGVTEALLPGSWRF